MHRSLIRDEICGCFSIHNITIDLNSEGVPVQIRRILSHYFITFYIFIRTPPTHIHTHPHLTTAELKMSRGNRDSTWNDLLSVV